MQSLGVFRTCILLGMLMHACSTFAAERPQNHHLFVSSVATDSALYIAGEHGQILKGEDNHGTLQWTQYHNNDLGLITSLSSLEHDTSETVSDTLIFTVASGQIGKITIAKNAEPQWNLLYSSQEKQEVNSLFDVVVIQKSHYVAAGAFGTLLHSHDEGNSWSKIAIDDENAASSHLYKIIALNTKQKSLSGFDFYVLGEFGTVLAGRIESKSLELSAIENPEQVTLFDGAGLSDRWLILAGVQGSLVAVDLKTNQILNSKLCTDQSIYGFYADTTSRNLLLAGDGGVIVRLSLLDEGENAPPALTCQFAKIDNSKISNLIHYKNALVILARNGIHYKNLLDLMGNLSAQMDLQW